MLRLLSLWLYLVSVLVPSAERVRWRDEWHADIDDSEASGATKFSPSSFGSLPSSV